MSHLKKFAKIAALAAVPLLVAGLAGCAPTAQGESTGTAKTSGGAGTSVDGGSGPQASAEYEEWYLKYAKCMRDKGVDVPDTPQSSMSITADDGYLEASESCEKNVGPAPGQSPGDEKATNEAMRAIAKCFREAGFDVADPKLGEAGQFPADAPQNVVDQCIAAGGQ